MNETIVDKWQRVFELFLLKDIARVTDLLPGDDPKIELALARSGFRGVVSAVDKSSETLARLAAYTRELGAQYRFELVDADILSSDLPQSDYIVGNHIMDDMLSYEFCQRNHLDPARMRTEPGFSREVWDRICRSTNGNYYLIQMVARNALNSLRKGGLLILSSYTSKFEHEHGFEHETRACSQLFTYLRKYATGMPYVIDWSEFLKAALHQDPKLKDQWLAVQKIN